MTKQELTEKWSILLEHLTTEKEREIAAQILENASQTQDVSKAVEHFEEFMKQEGAKWVAGMTAEIQPFVLEGNDGKAQG